MVEVNVHYDNLADRQLKVKEQEARGLRMLRDNFDPDWKPGLEPHGTMLFTDAPAAPPVPVVDWGKEFKEALTVEAKVRVLARLLGLEV